MVSHNSKVEITVPPSPTCFPFYDDEEEICEVIAKIGECHLQAVQIASWIASTVCPTYASNFVFTVATYLLTFIIHKLSTSEKPAPSTAANSKGSTTATKTTLEAALVDSKINDASIQKSACEMNAKMYVIRNRLERLSSNITRSEMQLEVVPAIQLCEEVIQLFSDPHHIFYQNPLQVAPIIAAFAGVFMYVAVISLSVVPSYREMLEKEVELLIRTLSVYKENCIKARNDGITLKSVQPASMLDVVGGKASLNSYVMEDSFTPYESVEDLQAGGGRTFSDGNGKEAVNMYRDELKAKYASIFDPAIESLSQFGRAVEEYSITGSLSSNNFHSFTSHDDEEDSTDSEEVQ